MKTRNTSAVARIARAWTIVIAAMVIAACSSTPSVPRWQGDKPASLLWVGNSFFYFNNSMHGHLGGLLNAAGVRNVRQTSVTISGAGLDWHDMGSHFKPGTGMMRYSFTPTNDVAFNTFDRAYDMVLMMDCSQCPIHPKLQQAFHDTVKAHAATVRQAGAEPALFLSWAYQDQPQMTEQLAAEYVKAGRANQMRVVPAGPAFAASIAKRPDLNLYAPDKRHPSLAGTYLGACVVMASLFRTSPVGNSYTAGLPPDVAQHLQAVAWETAQGFKP
ncbi:MAG: hypothetical protein U1E89_16275 [Burkholderiaceae bacterium]